MYNALLLMAPFVLAGANADAAAEKGRTIAVESDRRDHGWGDSIAEMTMTLRNKHGESSRRRIRIKTLEVTGDGDKSLVYFHSPRDVRGTAFLSFSHVKEADDQWLYLPALKRVKRISSRNKSGPFMGSEFAYEDIASQEAEKYRYKFLDNGEHEGQPAFVVERYPVYEDSGYTKQVVWFDEAEYRVMRVDFYDRKGALLKTLTYHGYRKYLDRYWRADQMRMVNHQNGKSTVLAWRNYAFGQGLSDGDFNKNRLKRAR